MNYLLFASQSYSIEIMRPLQQEIVKQGDTVAWYLFNLPEQLLIEGETLLTSIDEVNTFNPIAVFAPGNWVPDFFPGIKVEIFHGFGIEKKGHFRIRGMFDLYCTHGPATTETFIKLQNEKGFFAVKETGWPKMDPLFQNKNSGNIIDQVRGEGILLYAPTFSPSLSSAETLIEQIQKISNNQEYQWIIKFHPKMSKDIVDKYKAIQNDRLNVADADDILPLLQQADIMLTDTSSVISEFLLLDKPVITYKNRKPEGHTLNFDRAEVLLEKIQQCFEDKAEIMKNARSFIQQMHPYQDGLSSQRVLKAVDEFIETDQKRLSPKPLNLFRKLKCRKAMKYYSIK